MSKEITCNPTISRFRQLMDRQTQPTDRTEQTAQENSMSSKGKGERKGRSMATSSCPVRTDKGNVRTQRTSGTWLPNCSRKEDGRVRSNSAAPDRDSSPAAESLQHPHKLSELCSYLPTCLTTTSAPHRPTLRANARNPKWKPHCKALWTLGRTNIF